MNSSVGMHCVVNREFLQANNKAVVYLAVDINPPDASEVETANVQKPLNVCIAIDRSGSMRDEEKLNNAKIATMQLIQSLKPSDYVSVISFSDKNRVEVMSQPAGNYTIFQETVQNIKAGGATNIYSALSASLEELNKQAALFSEPTVSRVILLTDGQPTSGKKKLEDFVALAKEIGKNNISITTLGLGGYYNQQLLSAISAETGGLPLHVTDPNTIQQIFFEELTDMNTVIMVKPELRIKPISEAQIVDIYKVRPVLNLIDDPEVKDEKYIVPLGDLVGGQPQNIVFKVALPPKPEGAFRIAQVELISGKEKVTNDVVVNYTNNAELYSKETDSYPRVLLFTSQGTVLFREGVSMSDPTKINQAQTVLKRTMSDPNAVTVVKSNELTQDLVNRFNDAYEKTVIKKGVLTEEEKKQVTSQTTVIRKK
ncbi:MAG: VWA domain-containing protein [Candidatus Bathyarchaeota archaeon]|nr:VWA domain-containing protein [Candidatus Bathyarchaeota archaeon]